MRQDILYGLKDQEHLSNEIEDVIESLFRDLEPIDTPNPIHETIADGIEWPVMVMEYQRKRVDRARLPGNVLEDLLQTLDDEYADPDGNATIPTPAMNDAAKSFVDAVLKDYYVFQCDPTGRVVRVTREEALKMLGGAEL